jgi:TolA-binding protein
MFESLKTLWKKEQTPLQDYDQQSRQLAEEIARLEGELQRQPDNSDVQKTLMLTYNRALSVYAKSTTGRISMRCFCRLIIYAILFAAIFRNRE